MFLKPAKFQQVNNQRNENSPICNDASGHFFNLKTVKIPMKVLVSIFLVAMLLCVISSPVYAITENEVQAQVDSHGKESVAGNVFIWFLCAMSFLKVSQKIDSFMSSLGINVGHTGGSMLAEAMIAARGVSEVRGHVSGGSFRSKGGSSGNAAGGAAGAAAGAASFMSGGLAGAVGRQFSKSAMQHATGQGGGGIGGISGKMFQSSMEKGGEFANNVIGAVAKGNLSATGSIKGENASKALTSYMGLTEKTDAPSFSGVEIGGGRIMGTETSTENPNGIEFAMYNADQYMVSEGDYNTTKAVDGSKWYKQYATDAVEKTPYMTDTGKIAYNEKIVQKLPPVPRRKDRV